MAKMKKKKTAAKAPSAALVARVTALQNGLRAVRSRLSALERDATTAKGRHAVQTALEESPAPAPEQQNIAPEQPPPEAPPYDDETDPLLIEY
jgi:hypothetical protein